jgi:hypothetical protein
MKMLDLYSGLGGASQPFLDHGWNVLRIDNNPLLSNVPNTETLDIVKWELPPTWECDLTLLWASPPCLEFSQAFGAPKSKAGREGIPFEPNMDAAKKAKELIDIIQPKYWVVENVVGAIKDFNKIFGPPRQIIGPFVLWGNFPYLTFEEEFNHSKVAGDRHSSNPLRANYKALIPYPLANSLRKAIVEQRSILDWI